MKKLFLLSSVLFGTVAASQAGVSVHIGLPLPPLPRIVVGVPAPPVVVAAPPVVVGPPVCAPAPVVVAPPGVCAPPVVALPGPRVIIAPPFPYFFHGHVHHGHW